MSNTSSPIVREYARVPEMVYMVERQFILLYSDYARELTSRGYSVLTAGDFMAAMRIVIV